MSPGQTDWLQPLVADSMALKAALNESNPGLDVGDETVENVEGVFRRLRELLLGTALLSSASLLHLLMSSILRTTQRANGISDSSSLSSFVCTRSSKPSGPSRI